MGYCLYRPQPFEAGPGAESVRSVADSCWSRIKGRDKVELKLGCGNYDPQTPPSTLDSISLKDYPDRLLALTAHRRHHHAVAAAHASPVDFRATVKAEFLGHADTHFLEAPVVACHRDGVARQARIGLDELFFDFIGCHRRNAREFQIGL